MYFIRYFFVFLFLNCQVSLSQKSLKNELECILETDQSEEKKINALQNLLVKYKNHKTSPEIGVLLDEIGILFFKNKNQEKAIHFFKRSVLNLEKHKKTNLFELNRSRNNLAWVYMLEGRVNEQYFLLNQIIDDQGNDKHTFNAINNIAIIDSQRGDYYLGLNKLNLLLVKKHSLEEELIIRINIIKIFALMTELDSNSDINSNKLIIKNHHQFIENNFEKATLDKKLLNEFYNNLANIYEAIKDYDSALKLYLKSKKYFKEQNSYSEMFSVLNNIGYLYAKQKKTDLANNCFKEIIANSTDINQIATAYDNLGYFLNIKSEQKISYFQKAIQIILERKDTNFSLPTLETIENSGYQQDILVYLIDLAYFYVGSYKSTHQKKYLFEAKNTLYLIDELVSLIRYESNTDQSKLFWIEKGVNTYLLATEVCYLLHRPDEAFYFMEKNKALLLQENIKKFQAKLELQIPQRIQQEEYKLHYEVVLAEKKYQQKPNDISLRKKYDLKNKEFQTFMNVLHQKYPQYARTKQKTDIISLNKVVSLLKNDECFVTYFLNKEEGYGLFANSKVKFFFKIDDVASLQKNVYNLKKYTSQCLLDKSSLNDFHCISTTIFKSLFPFNDALNKIENKKLTVIADDFLLNLPFEALTVTTEKKIKDSYLINYAEISYLHSFSSYDKIKQWKNSAPKKILAVVPNEFENIKLSKLSRSKDVIDIVNKYDDTSILSEKNATKANFYDLIKDYQIIHLNTHAGVESKTQIPWIAFRNEKLTLDELYGIQNQAELVILDACKTNDGQMQSGEGIMSLSRAFFMNGSKSVLASLWNVNEKTGNQIIKSFYAGLEKGYSKSKALQLAKIDYLKQHQYSEILPYYWASFTLTGSTISIELEQKWYHNKQLMILLSIMLLVLIGILIRLKFSLEK